jgi:hypothetical protein
MADPQKINIDIKTTADTRAVDQADSAVKKLNGTVSVATADQFLLGTADKARVAEFAFYDLDEAVAKTGNSGAQLEPLVAQVKRVENAAKPAGMQVKNLGGFVNQAGFQITDFAVQVQGGQSAITAFSQQFPQLIGSVQQSGLQLGKISGGLANLPIGIGSAVSVGAVAIGIGVSMAVKAYDEMEAAEQSLADAVKRNAEAKLYMAAQQIKLQNQLREEFILSVYQKQAEELERQIRALDRINELRAAQGDTSQAQADAAVTLAKNTGGNVAAAEANAFATGVENKIDQLQGELQKAQVTAAEAQLALQVADSLLGEFRSRGDEYSDEFIKATNDQKAAVTQAENAALDLETQRQKYTLALTAIEASTDANLSDLTTAATAAQTAAAKTALAAIEAKAAEVGGEISSNARQAMADLQKALLDGVITPNEMALVIDAINQLRASRESADTQVLAGLTSLATTTAALQQTLPGLLQRIQAIEEASRAWATSTNF